MPQKDRERLRRYLERNRTRIQEYKRKRYRKLHPEALERQKFLDHCRYGLRHRHSAILDPFIVKVIKGLLKIGGKGYLVHLIGYRHRAIRNIEQDASWRWIEGLEEDELYKSVRTICLNDLQFTLRWMMMTLALEIRFQNSLGRHRNVIKKNEKYERRKQFLAFCHRVCASI
jgi:hypothetical protein